MSSRTIKLGLFVLFFAFATSVEIFAQETRQRLVANPLQPIEQSSNKISRSVQQQERNVPSEPRPLVDSSVISRPSASSSSSSSRNILTNDIFVRSTVSSRPVAAPANAAGKASASGAMAAFQQKLLLAMYTRVGIPYRYGSEGPSTYDCSGLVWDVFKEAGVDLQRTSAANMWSRFEAVDDADKYKFGTLVFFNGLGHIGIVIDDKTFYQASSSQGVTFSKFEGYWGKRIVGFRRVPLDHFFAVAAR